MISLHNISVLKLGISLAVILASILIGKFFIKTMLFFAKKIKTESKNKAFNLVILKIGGSLKVFLILLGVYIALGILDLPYNWDLFLGKFARALIVFSLATILNKLVDLLKDRIGRFFKSTDSGSNAVLMSFFRNTVKILVIILALVFVIEDWGYNISGLLAGLGIGGLAFAFAAKDTVSNIFGSFVIVTDKPFVIGDFILTPDVEGTVEQIGFRSTRIRTFDRAQITIPNSVMSNSIITNNSRIEQRRSKFRINISYSVDSKSLKTLMEGIKEAIVAHPKVLPDTVNVFFEKFGDNSMEFLIYFFVDEVQLENFLQVQQDINYKILDIFERMNIKPEFPSSRVYIENGGNCNER